MARAKHHHVVPRSYLSRFADAGGALAMLDTTTGKWILTHASNAAVRNGFYTVDLIEEGPSDEVEKVLGRIESAMISALSRIDDGIWPPSEADRRALADFIGLQSVRGVDFRNAIQGTYDSVAQKLGDLATVTGAGLRKQFVEEHGRLPTDAEFEALKRARGKVEVRADVPRNYHVVEMLKAAGEQALVVYAKQAHLLNAPSGSPFLTSDIPLVLSSETDGPFGAISLRMADEACLPIDRHHCLLFNHPADERERGPERTLDITSDRLDETNRRVIRQAQRFIYCHPDDKEIMDRLG